MNPLLESPELRDVPDTDGQSPGYGLDVHERRPSPVPGASALPSPDGDHSMSLL